MVPKPNHMSKRYFLVFGALLCLALLVKTIPSQTQRIRPSGKDTSGPLAVRAKDHKGQSSSTGSGVIHFTSALDNDYYLVDSAGKTGYLYIETRVDSFFNDNGKRLPLNLSIVLDRSGSMSGEKIAFARQAAKGIVSALQSEDLVSVVMYDDVVDMVQRPVHAVQKSGIHQRIDAIDTRGGTNLWGGTAKGYDLVGQQYHPGAVNRVLLISDGLANEGLTDPQQINRKVQGFKDAEGITLSTFGVGLDYNEVLMTEMAERGAGNYYFIESPAQMVSLFDRELNGMLKVAAQDAVLTVQLPRGVHIVHAHPFRWEEKNGTVTFRFRDLFSEETKGVLIKFRIDDGVSSELTFHSTLRYKDVKDTAPRLLSLTNKLQPTQLTEAWLTHFNKTVQEQKLLFAANEELEKAMAAADKGDYENAANVVNIQLHSMAENKSYVKDSRELKKMEDVLAAYETKVKQGRSMSRDSLKVMQKANRSEAYKLRNKKQ